MTPRRQHIALAAILLALAVALLYQAHETGITVDEPSHVLSAALYWQGADHLKPRDMPPLIKLTGGWVANRMQPPIPREHPVWKTGHEWPISGEMVMRMEGQRLHDLFFYSRLPFIVFPLLATTVLWIWARQLFGPVIGILTALAFALEPTVLGHGSLFKNDLAATLGYLLFWFTAWRYWQVPSTGRAVWLGAALLVALMAKMSMLFLLGVAPLIIILRRPTWRQAAISIAVVFAIAYLGAVAAYQFDVRTITRDDIRMAVASGVPKLLAAPAALFQIVPIPAAMWDGAVSLFQSDKDGSPIFFLGEVQRQGHPLYFLVALAVKVPASLQLLGLLGLALIGVAIWNRRLGIADLFWIVPPFLYVVLASLSSLQMGVRLILPALPFGLLICAYAARDLIQRRYGAVAAVALIALAAESAMIFPHGIAFFNWWSGGPDNALRYLANSNVDWGQDLHRAINFAREHHIEKLNLSYFGNDAPVRCARENELNLIIPPWESKYARGLRYAPEPGWYAISANLLPGQFFAPEYRDYYAAFRDRKPVAKAGYSIYIYKFD